MDFGSILLPSLADMSVRILCLALVAALAIRICQVRSASIQHAVWAVMLGAMLLLPVLTVSAPEIALPIFVEVTAAPESTQPTWPSAPESIDVSNAAPPESALPAYSTLALVIYTVVALVMFLRLLLASLLVRRLARHCAPIRDARMRVLLGRVAGQSAPDLVEAEWISVPMAAGWIRPRVLFPAHWRKWDEAKLEAALVHELAHVQRRDPLFAFIAGFNKCIFWFHPLSWWIERKLARLAEQAADDSSILTLGNRERYASILVEMAAAVRRSRSRWTWEAVAMAKSSEVSRRVERILNGTGTISRGITKGRWAAVALTAAPLVFGAAAIQLETRQIPAPSAGHPQSPPGDLVLKDSKTPVGAYKRWLEEDAIYIITEKEREAYLRLRTNQARDEFILQFWLSRDPTPGTDRNEVKEEHYRRIAYANDRFAAGQPGWKTDRGRVYITYGPPDEIESHPSGQEGKPPYEIWRYRSKGRDFEIEFIDSERTGEYREKPVVPRPDAEKRDFELRVPLDPRSFQFRKTQSNWQAVVLIYGRVRSARERPICLFEEVLKFTRPSGSADKEALWFRKTLPLPPGDYKLALTIRDASTRRIETRERTFRVPAGR